MELKLVVGKAKKFSEIKVGDTFIPACDVLLSPAPVYMKCEHNGEVGRIFLGGIGATGRFIEVTFGDWQVIQVKPRQEIEFVMV